MTEPEDERRDHDEVQVTVAFTMSDKERPFEQRYEPATMLGVVRKAAMDYFGAEEDPNHVFYLTFERERRSDDATVGSLAAEAKAIKLRLIKELTQG